MSPTWNSSLVAHVQHVGHGRSGRVAVHDQKTALCNLLFVPLHLSAHRRTLVFFFSMNKDSGGILSFQSPPRVPWRTSSFFIPFEISDLYFFVSRVNTIEKSQRMDVLIITNKPKESTAKGH